MSSRPSGLPAASNPRPSLRAAPAGVEDGASLQAVAGLQRRKEQHHMNTRRSAALWYPAPYVT
ncbi:hypothetical protein PVAP13_5NG164781 [Panicum virgatum]|uniref:Uncharacterized protein n=1 Tax=Panicum virgatum TaxID=38727 RepID=A0A8T0RN02_PANVG|nr:hypothetical protein PVAP13_5NG164781 [Panicum virgatum]